VEDVAGVDNIVEEFRYIIDVMKSVAALNEKSSGDPQLLEYEAERLKEFNLLNRRPKAGAYTASPQSST
jgi:hypothetical protein